MYLEIYLIDILYIIGGEKVDAVSRELFRRIAMGKAHGIEQGKKIRIFQGDFGRLFLWINLPKISKKF